MVDAEPPEALVGRAPRVSVLHPEVRRRGDDEEHEGSHAAQRATSRQRVQHRGEAGDSAVRLNIQQLHRKGGDGHTVSFSPTSLLYSRLCGAEP